MERYNGELIIMIVFGICKGYKSYEDGTFHMKVRIPSIHGPYKQQSTRSAYTQDKDLPWLPSILLPKEPKEGDVAVLSSMTESRSCDFIVIGLTGGNCLK